MIAPTSPPPPWAAGLPGDKNHRQFSPLSKASINRALDGISANDLEREVAQLVGRVHGVQSAFRVVAGFRDLNPDQLKLW